MARIQPVLAWVWRQHKARSQTPPYTEDARDNDNYGPLRHSRYRSADRGYDRRYGSKDEYKDIYRDGFRAGYDEGYRSAYGYERERRGGGIRLPWPFQ